MKSIISGSKEPESIKALRDRRRKAYSQIGKVFCKVMGEDVYFNNHGFQHIMFDGNGRRRKHIEIKTRLNLLPCAPVVVAHAKFSVDRIVPKEETKDGKEIIYHQLQHSIRSKYNPLRTIEVIVIIRKVGNGQPHFYSIRYGKKPKENRP